MAQKLSPPYIEGAIAAQSGDTLNIPYLLNYAIGENNFNCLYAKIKDATTNEIIGENIKSESYENGIAFFKASNLAVGQYYKIQLAFGVEGIEIGNYSTVGVFKYTAEPMLIIENHNSTGNLYTYTASYASNDATELLYSYRFVLSNGDMIVEDSGEILYSNGIRYTIQTDLEEFVKYKLTCYTTTINHLYASTECDVILNDYYEDDYLKRRTIEVDLDYDNGRVLVRLIEGGIKPSDTAIFILSRADNLHNYSNWMMVKSFNAQEDKKWIDYTVEQGVTYKYAMHRMNGYGFCSKKIVSDPITVDFEDTFLYDGEKQLRIRFNPKVTSMKNTILESKIDTIGGKHPFIFRNGDVNYKEFPIGGLISYLSDNDELFMTNSELGFNEERAHRERTNHREELSSAVRGTQINGMNIAAERAFKLRVLEWLTDGKVKLFRSPSEGNYIVRLMNTSLSPNDTLGRMLHTFSATAYESADFTSSNLIDNNLLDVTLADASGTAFADNTAYMKVVLTTKTFTKSPIDISAEKMGRVWTGLGQAQKPSTDIYFNVPSLTLTYDKVEGVQHVV